MNHVALFVFLALAGPGFLLLGIRSLRTRAWRDGVPVAELLIDRAMQVEPPPRNATDRRFALFNAWMFVLFGSFFSLALAGSLYSLVQE